MIKATLSVSAQDAHEHSSLDRMLVFSGIISSVMYVAMNLFVPMLDPYYNSVSQTVSELSAIGAPTRTVWIALGVIYTLLIGCFAWGVVRTAGNNKNLRVVGILLLVYAAVNMLWPLAPMHRREVIAIDGRSLTDTMHLVLTGATVLLMTAAMIFGAMSLGRTFRIYSIITIMVLLAFGVLTSLDAPKIDAGLPTPLVGVWERINVGVFLIWIVVLSLALLRKPTVMIRLRTRIA
ncbi:MAG TPA: DUF998 domain-containing protein [Cyclobacteriaceae bacterium]|nr:DUF998 domain-containing protein [Cyclobacteriaceae bacterium]